MPLQHKFAVAVCHTLLRLHHVPLIVLPPYTACTSAKFKKGSDDGGFTILNVYGAFPVSAYEFTVGEADGGEVPVKDHPVNV
jgi:hypothetical protein